MTVDFTSDKDKTAKDKETKTSKSVFFSKSSAPAAADPDSEDESYEPRAYVVNAIQSKEAHMRRPILFLTTTRFLDW